MRKLLVLGVLLAIAASAFAKLPEYPTFHAVRTEGTSAIAKLDFLCLPGLNNPAADTSFPVTMSFPTTGMVAPYHLSFSSGKLADGDWTCFANVVISTGERWPTNRVWFTLKQPAPASPQQKFQINVD